MLLSSALLLTALAGCGQGGEAAPSGSSSDADSETGTRDELIFVNYRDIRDLNPHLYAGEMYAQSILYDTLVSNTEDGYVAVWRKTGPSAMTAGFIPSISGTA